MTSMDPSRKTPLHYDETSLPSPTDSGRRWEPLSLTLPRGDKIVVRDDAYSERLRCDHPATGDGEGLGRSLLAAAMLRERPRVMVFARAALAEGLAAAGLAQQARAAGFYRGGEDCVVFGAALDAARAQLEHAEGVGKVQQILSTPRDPAKASRPMVPTERAQEDDAPAIAKLMAATFTHYPTPSGVPDYIATQLREGTPFRVVREADEVVACASADLVRDAQTAELTDCATRPDQRGRGLMQALLAGLCDDLRELGYPTAFTLARAHVPGVNLAFARLGFDYGGVLPSACRIGGGLEDITVWSRPL